GCPLPRVPRRLSPDRVWLCRDKWPLRLTPRSPRRPVPSPMGRGNVLIAISNHFQNCVADFFSVAQDIFVPKAKHPVSLFIKVMCTIIVRIESLQMLVPIQFDDQSCLNTAKVGKKWTNRKLSSKLKSFDSIIPNVRPQLLFGLRLARSQNA